MKYIRDVLPEIADSLEKELRDQRSYLKMIASENYCSPAVREAEGTILTDKYSEGFPYHRFYAGCENVDVVEETACNLACELFGADYAYVQPHSGADANLCAYWAVLNAKILSPKFEELKRAHEISINAPKIKTYSDLSRSEWDYLRGLCHNQKLLAMDYYSGSHLTHGYRQNISAQFFDCYYYGVNDDGYLDYEDIRGKALEVKPLILLAGYSAYPRKVDFRKFREIADECGAVLMVDMAHFAGLVAGKVFTGDYDPVKWADIVTTTTHKTLRGPRGGMILCKEWLKDSVNKGCPLVIGGPLQNMIAGKAVALKEALSDDFKEYAKNVQKNARVLAQTLSDRGLRVITGGTDNHMVLVDVSPFNLNGRQAEAALRDCGITCNRNTIPNDPNGPWYTSGLRFGTPALTTLGMGEKEMVLIGNWIAYILFHTKPENNKTKYCIEKDISTIKNDVMELLKKYPPYPEM